MTMLTRSQKKHLCLTLWLLFLLALLRVTDKGVDHQPINSDASTGAAYYGGVSQ